MKITEYRSILNRFAIFIKENKRWIFLLLCSLGLWFTFTSRKQMPNFQPNIFPKMPISKLNNHRNATSKWPATIDLDNYTLCLKSVPGINSSDIPKETLDHNSQFYKLTYKDTYGKPTFCKPNRDTFYRTYTKNLPTWESFYPDLVTSLNKYAELNPDKNSTKFTSRLSYINLDRVKPEYKVGEIFEATIQAMNFEGEKKHFGGDYYRARLVEVSTLSNSFPNGIPCNIQDQMNGTYKITAPLLLPGTFKLEVVLGASVEAVAAYIDWTARRVHQGWIFHATLQTDEVVECNIDLLLYDK